MVAFNIMRDISGEIYSNYLITNFTLVDNTLITNSLFTRGLHRSRREFRTEYDI